MEWKNTDPRIDIYKRANIVICRLNNDGKIIPGIGHVDTKEVDCIWTSFNDYRFFSEKSNWNPDFIWTYDTSYGKYEFDDWKNTDPRFSTNQNILIRRPSNFGISCGQIDENIWSIYTSFEDHKKIDADEKWDEDWYWLPAPEMKKDI